MKMHQSTGKFLLTIAAGFTLTACAEDNTLQQGSFASGVIGAGGAPVIVCTSQPLDARFDKPVLQQDFDNILFDAAIRHYTNKIRCENGVRPLVGDPGLQRAAITHSQDMATRGFFSHTSPVSGRETLRDRLHGENVRIRTAGENIATRPRLQIGGGQPFYIVDVEKCQFTLNDSLVEPHTYNTLADSFVKQWENSPDHWENLMRPGFTRLGSGGSFQSNPDICGDIVATQNFAS